MDKIKDFFVGMWNDPKVSTAVKVLGGAVVAYVLSHFGVIS